MIMGEKNKSGSNIHKLIILNIIIFFGCEKTDSVNDFNYGTVMDASGNNYKTIEIGSQIWMAENLRTLNFANGDEITLVYDPNIWQLGFGAVAVYPYDNVQGINSENEMINKYGLLYNFRAVQNSKGICPVGWRVPSDEDWDDLENYIIGNYNEITSDNIGNSLKSCRQSNSPLGGECSTSEHPFWRSHGEYHGLDLFGFSALPSGFRQNGGSFMGLGLDAYFWTSTFTAIDYQTIFPIHRQLKYESGKIIRDSLTVEFGFSIRCIKN